MIYMTKAKDSTLWIIGILVIGAILVNNGTIKLSSLAAGVPAATTPAGATIPGSTPVSSVCPAATQNFATSVVYPDFTKSPLQLTLVASQTVNSYSQTPTASTTVTSSVTSSSSNSVPLSGINCNFNYLLTAGDNSGYFLNSTVANIGTSLNFPVQLVVPKYSAVTLTVANAVQQVPAANVFITAVQASKTVTAYLVIAGGQYTASQGPMALSFSYNSVAIQSISVGGLPLSGVSVPPMTFQTSNTMATQEIGAIGTQNTQGTVLVSPIANFQYATGSGSSVGAYEIPITIITTSAYAANDLISFQVTPGTSFFNTATGTVQSGVFRNPQTLANLFTPVALNTAIILQQKGTV